jgi:predicted lipoprotein with Yx(FWY)xxD motif
MRTKTIHTGAVALVAALAIAVAGCGGDDNSTTNGSASSGSAYGGGGATTSTAASSGGTGVVSVANNPKLGSILVDSSGMTLYYFEKDKGGKSACNGACASVWPPLQTSGKPTAEKAANASMLGTTQRNDGTEQVTYNNLPLYTYTGDSKPGDANGNDLDQFGAEWYALTPAGNHP